MKTRKSYCLLLLLWTFVQGGAACRSTAGEPEGPEDTGKQEQTDPVPGPEIRLLSPSDGERLVLDYETAYAFSWENREGEVFHRLYLSLQEDMSGATSLTAKDNPFLLSGRDFSSALAALGVGSGEETTVYWSVGPFAVDVKYTPQVRRLEVVNLEADGVHDVPAAPVKVKVAVVIEDPVYRDPDHPSDARNGKRIHEIEGWNDPLAQLEEFAAVWEEVSHGVVDIEIVEVHDSDRMFCYTTATANAAEREYMTPQTLYRRYLDPDPANGKSHIDIDGKTLSYDYVAMMDAFGLSEKVDAGTVNEVWVYNHPACKMNESRFLGEGGFWCNSGPVDYGTGRDKAHNKKLVCVMFCNYERTVDLAMHSFAHRTESILSQLNYNNYWGFPGNSYSRYGVFTYVYDYKGFSGRKEDLLPFDMFFAHGSAYDKVGEHGYAHIGICHSPCNTDVDYGYEEKTTVYSFADEWLNYPYIYGRKDQARLVNCNEWSDPKGYQYGYMKWFFSHIPHFEGINTFDKRDLHLNNWWHYLFDYYGALEREAALRSQLDTME